MTENFELQYTPQHILQTYVACVQSEKTNMIKPTITHLFKKNT